MTKTVQGGKWLAPLLTFIALAGCGGGSEDPAPISGSVVQAGRIDERLVGSWRVLGEGTLLEVSRDGVTQFQQGESLCYADELASTSDTADLVGQSFKGSLAGARASVELFELEGTPASSMLERIAGIPPTCRAQLPADPATTFRALCELMGQDYAFFVQRHIDWPTRCSQLAPQANAARDDDALQLVLIAALQGFNDDHVKLYRGHGEKRHQVFSAGDSQTRQLLKQAFDDQTEFSDMREFQLVWRELLQEKMAQRLSAYSGPMLNGGLRWGRLTDDVGYIAIDRMMGYSGDASPAAETRLIRLTMDRAIAELADTRALIIDVSLNGGGLDAVSAEIASRFADRRRLAFTKQAHRPQGRAMQSWYVEPRGPAQYLKPVYVLTSDLSGSAAETFTLMMRSFPHVRHAGQATAGAISDVLEKPLPGNFSISFSNEIDLDPHGVLYEVSGIPPQWALPMFRPGAPESLLTGQDAAIDALIAIATR